MRYFFILRTVVGIWIELAVEKEFYNPYLLRQIQIELSSATKVLETETEGSELSHITLSNLGSFTL